MSASPGTEVALRASPQNVLAWLDRLDQQAGPRNPLLLRRSQRFRYRPPSLTLELLEPDRLPTRCVAAGRDLSREGLGCLVGRFVYPGTPCRTTLVDAHGTRQTAEGRIARCSYLAGSGWLYAVGVEFERPVEVSRYVPEARLLRILLVGFTPATQELIAGFLRPRRVELKFAASEPEAVAAANAGELDLVLVDLDDPSVDGFGLTRRLRSEGYLWPAIGVTIRPGAEVHGRCVTAGLTGYLSKPILRDQLENLLESLSDQPLTSSLADDPALAPLIDRFVGGLRERVKQMTRAIQAGELPSLERMVRALRAEAGSYGFESLTEEAAQVEALIAGGSPVTQVRPALDYLLHLCLKARPATCPPDRGD